MATPISKEQQKKLAEDHETAEILKKSLVIVDKLSKMDADDILADDDEMEKLERLIEEAKKLTKHRLWHLK
jgi:archaellum biogenesis ATPase FlaH